MLIEILTYNNSNARFKLINSSNKREILRILESFEKSLLSQKRWNTAYQEFKGCLMLIYESLHTLII